MIDENKMKFIIYAPEYNENVGGILVLHKLCDYLNKLGYKSYIWIEGEPPLNFMKYPIRSFFRYIKNDLIFRKKYKSKFKINKEWNTPLSKLSYIDKNTIVIYPEIISGNPLNAKNVVRWLLYYNHKFEYSKDEFYCFYSKNFKIKNNSFYQIELQIKVFFDEIYYNRKLNREYKICYMLRKGKNKINNKFKQFLEKSNAINIDGKSHKEIADIFNKCKYFISFDVYSYYNIYATICGCISVVVPDDNLSEKEWRFSHGDEKYGIAYGCKKSQLKYAESTMDLLKNQIEKTIKNNEYQVNRFVSECLDFFNKKDKNGE